MPFVDDETCADAYPGETDHESMLCAGDLENGGSTPVTATRAARSWRPAEDGGQILVGIVLTPRR